MFQRARLVTWSGLMSFEQSTDSEDEATENTRLMSETVAMENRAYNVDHVDSRTSGGRHDDSSRPAVIIPSTETVSSLLCHFAHFLANPVLCCISPP